MLLLDDTALFCLLKRDQAVPPQDDPGGLLGARIATVTMRARGSGIACGTEEAGRMFTILGCAAEVAADTGAPVEAGDLLVAARGPAPALLSGWQAIRSLIEWASGVATATGGLVRAARAVNPEIAIACPRKAIPGARPLALKAVTAGGAEIHHPDPRHSAVIFAEHWTLGGAKALKTEIGRLHRTLPRRRAVVEVRSCADAIRAAELGADMLHLQRFAPEEVAATVRALGSGWADRLVAVGAIAEDRVAPFAASGVHAILSTAPYHAPPAELEVGFEAG